MSPVDVRALRAFLLAHAVAGVDTVEHLADGSSRHQRWVTGEGGPALLTVTLPALDVGSPTLSADGPADPVREALAAGHRWVGLDVDPSVGVAALAEDPVLGPLVGARPHLRVPGAADPFEAAVLVVLGQHVSLAAGRRFAARLVASFGVGCPDGRHRFPDPALLASLDPVTVQRAVGIPASRANAVVALGRAVADRRLTLSSTADRRSTRGVLLGLPGVGPWTADLVALRCLRDPDVFLPGDLVLRRALGGVSAADAGDMAHAWAPHRSLAVLHLWTEHALDPRR